MSDPVLPTQSDVGDLVLQAPETTWKKIKKALGVQTREQAAAMVEADDKARKRVISLLSGFLTRPPSMSKGFLTEPRQARPPLAEQMYGAKKAKAVF